MASQPLRRNRSGENIADTRIVPRQQPRRRPVLPTLTRRSKRRRRTTRTTMTQAPNNDREVMPLDVNRPKSGDRGAGTEYLVGAFANAPMNPHRAQRVHITRTKAVEDFTGRSRTAPYQAQGTDFLWSTGFSLCHHLVLSSFILFLPPVILSERATRTREGPRTASRSEAGTGLRIARSASLIRSGRCWVEGSRTTGREGYPSAAEVGCGTLSIDLFFQRRCTVGCVSGIGKHSNRGESSRRGQVTFDRALQILAPISG